MKFANVQRLLLYATALYGPLALLTTGEYSTQVILLFMLVMFGSFFTQLRNIVMPDWMANVATMAVFVGMAALARSNLFDAVAYFFLFLQVIKLYAMRSHSDVHWVYTITLFLMIGTSALTTSLIFGVVFLGYLALMVFSLTMLTIQGNHEETLKRQQRFDREAFRTFPSLAFAAAGTETAKRKRWWVREPVHRLPTFAQGSLRPSLVVFLQALTVVLLALTIWLFLVIPRLSTQSVIQPMQRPTTETESTSAFSADIKFGELTKISLDPRVALYVRPLDEKDSDHVRLRGVALTRFSGDSWSRGGAGVSYNRLPFAPFHRPMPQAKQHRYLMIQQPELDTPYLFGETFPQSIRTDRGLRFLFDSQNNTVRIGPHLPHEFHYTVESRGETLDQRIDPSTLPPAHRFEGEESERPANMQRWLEQLRSTMGREDEGRNYRRRDQTWQIDDGYRAMCLELSDSLDHDRLRSLAEEWTQDATTPFEQARALERTFHTTFGYTLTPEARGNIIEDFLYNKKRGHCEYFATSMALMVRTIGLPSRVINGFVSYEWNDIAKAFVVRQSDAHSWVEIYFDGYGWMTFDPTPADGIARRVEVGKIQRWAGRMSDALRVRWYRYMIDYSFADQTGIIRSVLTTAFSIHEILNRVQVRESGQPWSFSSFGRSGSTVGIAVVTLGVILVGVGVALFWRSKRTKRTKKRNSASLVKFHTELMKRLGRLGLRLRSGETSREFSHRVVRDIPDLAGLPSVIETYYALRFYGREPQEDEWQLIDDVKARLSSPKLSTMRQRPKR